MGGPGSAGKESPMPQRTERRRKRRLFYVRILNSLSALSVAAFCAGVWWTHRLLVHGSGTNNVPPPPPPRRTDHLPDGISHPAATARRKTNTGTGRDDIRLHVGSSGTSNSTVPPWITDYVSWHQRQRRTLTETNWNSGDHRFLVVRCLRTDAKCGGTADRLKPLPLAVTLAAHAEPRRLLLVEWERPHPLTEFLHPVAINWTMPSYMRQQVDLRNAPRIGTEQHIRQLLRLPLEKKLQRRGKQLPAKLPAVVTMLYQSHQHGANLYDEFSLSRDEPVYDEIFRDVWKFLFQPAPAVQQRIDQTMHELHLEPNRYVAVHVRSQYDSKTGPNQLKFLARNAMNCASQLRHEGEPVYVATDSAEATQAALLYAKKERHFTQAVAASQNKSVLHLDRGSSFVSKDPTQWTEGSPVDYYSTFVDVYVMAQARCRARNVGNYGTWANLLSQDPTCTINYMKQQCRWKNA